MRRLVWALFFTALAAHAGRRVPSYHYRTATSGAALEFLVAGGGAASMMPNTDSTFANAYSSDIKQGNWFLLQGDGESEPGGLSLSAVGSPSSQALRTCGNGAYCGSVTGQRLSDGNNFATASSATPRSGDFSACALVQLDSIADAPDIVMQWTGVTATSDWAMTVSAAGTPALTVSNGSASTNTNGGVGSVIPRAVQLICVTYDFVADGTSVGKVYVDGVQGGSGSSTMGGLNAGSTAKLTIGSRNGASAATNIDGRVLLAFKTDTLLSASTISSMASALLGAGLNVYAADGTALTISRASPIFCPWDESLSGGTWIPPGRPCGTMGGLLAAPGETNFALWFDDFTQTGTWAGNAGTVTRTANTWTAPDGSLTGDTLSDNDAATNESILQGFSVTNGTTYTFKLWLKANSGDPLTGGATQKFRLRCGTNFSAGSTAFTPTSTATLVSHSCTASATATAFLVLETDDAATTGSVDVWGAHMSTGPGLPIRTEASTVTRATQTPSFTTPSGFSVAAGEVRFRFRPLTSALTAGTFFDLSSALSADGYMAFAFTGGAIRYTHRTGGANTNTDSSGLTWTSGQAYDMRFAWGAGAKSVLRDGASVASATGLTLPSSVAATMQIGNRSGGSDGIYGVISDFEVAQ